MISENYISPCFLTPSIRETTWLIITPVGNITNDPTALYDYFLSSNKLYVFINRNHCIINTHNTYNVMINNFSSVVRQGLLYLHPICMYVSPLIKILVTKSPLKVGSSPQEMTKNNNRSMHFLYIFPSVSISAQYDTVPLLTSAFIGSLFIA